ncbi:MAG: 50S ribosomal protein L5 [Infirmifilum sp.]|jgi:large subunit ribosomal protein L5|uniref:Large ribosomal subunit protein uL5 n=1 Tax=Infirmifilum uzonense TaxID=1550241 RepID=A0A0F7FG12_9CREN|nr:50S ribosomal protein L5 [Infirmifilum uzonense]AKG38045.1 50S ribosomal protein L5 [Infirmifilum uzonense]
MKGVPVMETGHPMRRIFIAKVVVNIGVGEGGERLAKAAKLLEELTGQKPSLRRARKSIKDFGVRKGENIAAMVTLRGEKAISFLKKAFAAVENRISESSIDRHGNFAFGVREHILVPGVKYDPEVGIFGFDVIVGMERPGYRVKRRRRKKSKIGRNHYVTKEETIAFLEKVLGVQVIRTKR